MRSINIFGSSVTHELWGTKNVLNHTVKLGFFTVPVLNLKVETLLGEGLGQGFDEGHRTVFAAGTAHGHGHIGFAFMMILGHEKGHHVLNFGQKRDLVSALKELEGSSQPKPSSQSDSDSDSFESRALVTADQIKN